jgi:hypothetical protein
MPGEVLMLRSGSSIWAAGADGVVYASLIRA